MLSDGNTTPAWPLPAKTSASGLQLASHVLGGVMNIGAFALIAASMPQKLGLNGAGCESARRGMNGAVLWSPFFISFAVANIYLPSGISFGAIMLGLVTAVLFSGNICPGCPGGCAFFCAGRDAAPAPNHTALTDRCFGCSVVGGDRFHSFAGCGHNHAHLMCHSDVSRPQTARQIARTFWYLQKAAAMNW